MGAAQESKRVAGFRLKPFLRNKRGVTAIEFGMVSVPFFWLMMGLAEIGMIFVVQTNVDFSIMQMERQIRTGQVQQENLSAAKARERVCVAMNKILTLNCDANLFVDVRSFPSFSAMNAPDPTADGKIDQSDTAFQPGAPNEVVLVRTYYKWKLLTPVISKALANYEGDSRLIASAALFRNEPY